MFKLALLFILTMQVAFSQESTKKIFYIDANVTIDKEMNWDELGVASEENFKDTLKKFWVTWAKKNFTKFDSIEIGLPPTVLNTLDKETNLLSWISSITKSDFDDYQISAQVNISAPKTGNLVFTHNFPTQKILIDFANKKDAGSKLASLIYNSLNTQTASIKAVYDEIKLASETSHLIIPLKGKHGLSEMLEVKTVLESKFKDINLAADLKSYLGDESSFTVNAKISEDRLLSMLVEAGKLPLNEQKILLFNREDKSFAILPKEQNN
jgi:ligand-binding SRPBCC domain-containing protein